MNISTNISKIKQSKSGRVTLKIGTALENTAFECACGNHDDLDLCRDVPFPTANNAYYTVR